MPSLETRETGVSQRVVLHHCREARKQRAWHVAYITCKMEGMKYSYARVSTNDQTPALKVLHNSSEASRVSRTSS